MAANERAERRRAIRDILVIGLVSVLIIVWAGVIFFLIGDRPRDWDYGSYEYIPGESYSTTEAVPKRAEPPSQVELPPSAEEPAQ